MANNIRVLTFAITLAVVCSALVAGFSIFTEPRRVANERADEVRNVLESVGADVPPEADAQELLDIFQRTIDVMEREGITLYQYTGASGGVEAIAVPVTGAGLWGPIEGAVALEPDLRTIRGVRFFRQQETPGLGGEIGAAWFQEQFSGKSLVSPSGRPGFEIVRPDVATDQNSVEGITGATMTSDKVEIILDTLAKRLAQVR